MSNFDYERNFFSYFDNLKAQIKVAPTKLSGGIGGYIGNLPQTRVAYDTEEVATSGIPASGISLVDNLNHIRYRLENLENNPAGISVYDNNTLVSEGVTIIDFIGADVTLVSPGRVSVQVSGRGNISWGDSISGWGYTTDAAALVTTSYVSQVIQFIQPAKLTSLDIRISASGTYTVGFVANSVYSAGRANFIKNLGVINAAGAGVYHLDFAQPFYVLPSTEYFQIQRAEGNASWYLKNSATTADYNERVNDLFTFNTSYYGTTSSTENICPVVFSGYLGTIT